MKYEKITNIYHEYVNSPDYSSEEFSFGISNENKERLIAELGEKKYSDIEDIAMRLGCDAEEIGFIQGFRVAMQIMKECF